MHTLDAIIGRYAFADKVPCGLSNCHQPHGKGYIVVTKDGRETNIGKHCGKTYFGVDFETLSNKFDRDITEKENREKLWSFFFRSDEVALQVATIRNEEHGANWVYKYTINLQNIREIPPKVVRRLGSMVKARDPRLTLEREATDEEMAQLEQAQGRRLPRPQYTSVSIGEIAGLDVFYPENNLRVLLVDEVEERIKALNAANIDTLTYEQLRKWSKWLGGLEAVLDWAVQTVRSGRVLLRQSNLSPLSEAVELNTEDHQHFHKFLKHLPQG